jgi:hypothetical protein
MGTNAIDMTPLEKGIFPRRKETEFKISVLYTPRRRCRE